MTHAKSQRREDSGSFASSRLRVIPKTDACRRWLGNLLSQVTRLESTRTRREATRTQLLTAAIHAMLEVPKRAGEQQNGMAERRAPRAARAGGDRAFCQSSAR